MQYSPEMSPECMPIAPSYPPLIKWRKVYWTLVLFLALFFPLGLPPPGIFLVDDALVC